MKEFKKGDTAYWGTLKGTIVKTDKSELPLCIEFKNDLRSWFTKDGRINPEAPAVISHFPYEMEMKRVELDIDKDTKVWFRDDDNQSWKLGYYSKFEDNEHYVFHSSKKSTETDDVSRWNIVVTEDPLK